MTNKPSNSTKLRISNFGRLQKAPKSCALELKTQNHPSTTKSNDFKSNPALRYPYAIVTTRPSRAFHPPLIPPPKPTLPRRSRSFCRTHFLLPPPRLFLLLLLLPLLALLNAALNPPNKDSPIVLPHRNKVLIIHAEPGVCNLPAVP